jgi:thiamine biosynthesis lipoprotein
MVAVEHPGDTKVEPVATVPLKDESLSVSAVWGKSFSSEGQTYGHVLDPRSGRPGSAALLAAVVLPSATETDALSTALLTLGPPGMQQICACYRAARGLVVFENEGRLSYESYGMELNSSVNSNVH